MYTTNQIDHNKLIQLVAKYSNKNVLRDHPLFSAFSQGYREYARGEGVNPVVNFQKCWSQLLYLYMKQVQPINIFIVRFWEGGRGYVKKSTSSNTIQHKILAGDNFGEFGEMNVICQYFTQPIPDSLKQLTLAIVNSPTFSSPKL